MDANNIRMCLLFIDDPVRKNLFIWQHLFTAWCCLRFKLSLQNTSSYCKCADTEHDVMNEVVLMTLGSSRRLYGK